MIKNEESVRMDRKDFSKMPEQEVIRLAQKGNDEAMDYMLETYKSLVRVLSRPLFLIDGDKDDLIQEGMIGLFKAVNGFDASMGAAFETFATQCINRQMYSAVKKSNRKKNIPLNYYISIYTPAGDNEDKGNGRDYMVDKSLEAICRNPEDIIIDQENARNIERRLYSRLSTMERQVLDQFLRGLTYQEIAEKLDRTPKTIDNALQRIKAKLSRLSQ